MSAGGGQCCQQPFEDHRVGFSCSKPDRFLGGGGGVGVSEGKGWVRVRDSGDSVGSGFARCLYNSNVYVLIALTLFTALDQIERIFSE